MIATRDVTEFLPDSVQRDLRWASEHVPPGRLLRLVRVPAEVFTQCIDRALARFGAWMPMRPVVLGGIPIDMTEGPLPEAVLVADDDTNLTSRGGRAEKEITWQR